MQCHSYKKHKTDTGWRYMRERNETGRNDAQTFAVDCSGGNDDDDDDEDDDEGVSPRERGKGEGDRALIIDTPGRAA